MTTSHALARVTRRKPLGRLTPKCFSAPARWRFIRDRRSIYLARVIPGSLSDWQAVTIESLIALEWSALRDEAGDTPQGRREGREHRRLFQRLLADFEHSLPSPAAKAPSLAEHLARRAAEREAGALV